jgi:hypothetical protein
MCAATNPGTSLPRPRREKFNDNCDTSTVDCFALRFGHERTDLARQKERASTTVVSAEKRAAETDARIALETAQHQVQQRYAEELRDALEMER